MKSPEFQELWDRIRHRTEYRVDVDENELRVAMVTALRDMPPVPRRRGEWLTHRVEAHRPERSDHGNHRRAPCGRHLRRQ